MKVELQTPSLFELQKAFESFGPSVATKHLAPAVEAAAEQALKRLEKNVPKGPTGNLRKGLGVKVIKYMENLTAVGLAGYKIKGGRGATNHMHLLEYGTKERTTKGRFASSYKRQKFKVSWPSRGQDAGRMSVLPQNRFNFYYVNWKGGTVKTGRVQPMRIIERSYEQAKGQVRSTLKAELTKRLAKATKEFAFRVQKGINT